MRKSDRWVSLRSKFRSNPTEILVAKHIWFFNCIVIGIVTIAAMTWQGFTSSLVSIREGCGNDGGHLCAMAGTSPLPNFPYTPHSQRVLLPFLVKTIFNPKTIIDTISGFALINSVLISCSSILIFLIIRQLGNFQNRYLPFIGSFLFLLHPFTYRINLTYPVLTDQLTIFLILLSVFLLIQNNTVAHYAMLWVYLLLILTRLHVGLIPIFLSSIFYRNIKLKREIMFTTLIIVLFLGLFIALTSPYYGSSNSDFFLLFKTDIINSLTDASFLERQLLLIFGGLGAFSCFVIFYAKQIRENFALSYISLFAFSNLMLSLTFGAGGDTDRYLMLSGILILITIFVIISKSDYSNFWILPSIYGTIFLWEPFVYKFEDEGRFEFMFARRWTEPSVVLQRSKEAILISLLLVTISFYMRYKSHKKLESTNFKK